MSLAAGELLGPYKILGRLGAGGMGEVYRAHDSRLQREVAIKILPLALAHDRDALGRLEREAHAIAALNHPNLLTIFDVGTLPAGSSAAGSPFLVSELLEGGTLRSKLADGPLPPRKGMDYAAQIARGLAAAHAKGIIHRDLKPENLFCCDDGRVKVLDFGLAKAVATASSEAETVAEPAPAVTQAGVMLGTMGYMSPEQARGKAADARSDIFSLGAVLYEMLAGRRAFTGESGADVLSAILREDPPELSATGRSLPPALERIVRHCLEKEPAQRFQSAGDIAFQLQELMLASSVTGAAPAAPERGLSRRWRFAAAGTAALIIVAVAAWFTARATAPPVVPLFTHLTYRQGTIVSARLLPGGQGFVGSASWNNSAHISVFSGRLGTRSVLSLSGPGGEVVAVSQQGDLAVLQHYSEVTGGILARMPLSGGAPRPVLDNIEAADWRTGALATSAAIARFNPVRDDTTLEYPVGHVLFTTPASVTGLRISPNGRSLAFIEHFTSNDDKGRIALLPVDGGKERDLTRDYESALGLAWAPSGKAIWFTASDGLENFLHAVSLSGHVRTLFRGATDLQLCDVDAAGRALMISTNRRYLAKLMTPGSSGPGRAGAPGAPGPTGRQAGGVAQPRQAPRQSFVADISVLDASVYTALSADGKQVAIGDEDAGPNYSTYLRATTPGADPVRLGEGEPLGISPDGKWVVSILPTGPRQLVLLPTGVGQQQQLTHGAIGFVPVRVAWLPDSQSFIVLGNKPGEAYRSFQVNLHGQVKPVTAPGVASWVLTPDGRSLLAQTHAKPAYALYPLHGGAASPVKGLLPGDFPLRFGTAGDLLVARSGVLDKGTAFQVYRVNLHNGSRSLITTVPVPDSAGVGGISPLYMSISADGKTVSFGYMRELSTLGLLTGLR